MSEKIHNIIIWFQKSMASKILSHLLFWIIVGFFYFLIFSWNNENREVSIIFSAGLLPLAILVTYFFNYMLVPQYLWKKRIGKFFLLSFYTLLVSTWLSFLIVSFVLVYFLNKNAFLEPSALHPELQIISLNFIVFMAIAIKQAKRTFYMYQEKNELEKTKLTTELKLKEAELKLLKAQIHPHFLFNTLNNLYGLTIEKSDEAPGLVLRLSEILDYILYKCDEPKVLLSEEVTILRNYIEIEKLRYSEKLKLELELPNNTEKLKIAPLIILPFIENAFKHGVSKFPGFAFVKINITVNDQQLRLKVENTKNPVQSPSGNYSKGIGLINVQKRLELVYPKKYILKVEERDKTFLVNLTLELEP